MRRTARLAIGLLWAATAVCEAGDESWIQRLEAEAKKAEEACAALDGKKAGGGQLAARVKALHARVVELEKAKGLAPGRISEQTDLLHLTQDLVGLNARLKNLVKPPEAEKDGPSAPKPAPKVEEAPPSPGKPTAPTEVKWPKSLTFKATARITYEEVGEWFLDEMHRSGLGPDFLMEGYAGTISFTVRAVGLVREIRSARMRVIVKMRSPFTASTNLYRTYEIDWTAKQSLWNAAVKTWANHDDIEVDGPVRWIDKPRKVTADWEAEAHVRSVVTKDGRLVEFEVPEMVPAR